MKKVAFISILLLPFLFSFTVKETAGKPQKAKLGISWEFVGVEEGYDHDTKCKVWIDDEYAGESTVKKETEPNKMKIKTTVGSHTV